MAGEVDGDKSESKTPQPEFSAEELERIRRIDVENIRVKVLNGDVLTREQIKRLEMALPSEEVGERWVESQQKLAEALGISDRKSIQRWMKEDGCPGEVGGKGYNVKDWKLWCETKGKRAGTISKSSKLDSLKEKTVAIDLRLKELELDEAMGRVIEREECLTVLTEMITRVTQSLRGLKHVLAPQVVGETVPEAGKRIGAAIDRELEGLAMIPEGSKKKVFWRSVSMLLSDHLQMLLPANTP